MEGIFDKNRTWMKAVAIVLTFLLSFSMWSIPAYAAEGSGGYASAQIDYDGFAQGNDSSDASTQPADDADADAEAPSTTPSAEDEAVEVDFEVRVGDEAQALESGMLGIDFMLSGNWASKPYDDQAAEGEGAPCVSIEHAVASPKVMVQGVNPGLVKVTYTTSFFGLGVKSHELIGRVLPAEEATDAATREESTFSVRAESYAAAPLSVDDPEQEPTIDESAQTTYTVRYMQIEDETLTPILGYDVVTEMAAVGTEVTAEAIDIPGYELQASCPASQTITIDAEGDKNIITFNYLFTGKYDYTVNYLVDGQDDPLRESTTSQARFGEQIWGESLAAAVLEEHPGYVYLGAQPNMLDITTDEAQNVTNLYFALRSDLTYTVKYIEADTETNIEDGSGNVTGTTLGNSLASDDVVGDQAYGSLVKVEPKDIRGYELVSAIVAGGEKTLDELGESPVATLTIGIPEENADPRESENVVIFYYRIRTDISYTVNYLKAGTRDQLAEPKTVTGKTYNETVTEEATDILGYMAVNDTRSLTLDVDDNQITFYYEPRNDLSYTVQCVAVYEGGEEVVLGEQEYMNQTFGSTVEVIAPDRSFDGYDLREGQDSAFLTIAVENEPVVFYYTPRTDLSYTVQCLTIIDNMYEVLREETVSGQTAGAQVTVTAPEIDGYELESWSVSEQTFQVTPNYQVMFEYKKSSDITYTVNYLDQDGNPLKEADTIRKQVAGTQVTTAQAAKAAEAAEELAGYVYDDTRASTLTLSEDNASNVLNVYYAKRTDLTYTVQYLEKVGDEYQAIVDVDPVEVTGITFGTQVPVLADARFVKEIDGYTYDGANTGLLTVGVEENVIRLYYVKRTDLSYTVKHVDANGNELDIDTTHEGQTYGSVIEASSQLANDIPGYAYDEDRNASSTLTISANSRENILYIYYKAAATSYVVNFYKDATAPSTPQLIEATDPIDGAFGDRVTVEQALQMLSEEGVEALVGYRFARAEANGSELAVDGGITLGMDSAGNAINLYYVVRDDCSYTVRCVTVTSGEVKVLDEKSYTGQVFGSTLTVEPQAIEGYVAPESRELTIGADADQNVITFVFAPRVDLSYTVNYYETGSNTPLRESRQVNDQTFGSKVGASSEAAVQIEGYVFDEEANEDNTLTIGVDDEQNVLNVYFAKRTDLSYTVSYLEEGTETELADTKEVSGQIFKDSVTEEAIDIAGYNKPDQDEATIQIEIEGNRIAFYYTKRTDLSYTVNYLEQETGRVLSSAKIVNGKTFQDSVTEEAIDISGYNKVAPFTLTTIIGADENAINFYYTPRTDLSYTVRYLKEGNDHIVLHEQQVVTDQTFNSEVTEQDVREAGAVASIDGYEVASTSESITIVLNEGLNVFDIYYAPRTDLSYTVKYLEAETGKELADPKKVDGQTFNLSVTEKAVEIEGYVPNESALAVQITTGKNELTFEYTIRTDLSYTVNYLEHGEDGGSPIDGQQSKTVDSQTYHATATEKAPDVEGYTLVGDAEKSITIGVGQNVINFYYEPRHDLSYTVSYLEEGTETELADTKEVSGQTFKDSVTEEAIDIAGYNKPDQAESTIQIKVEGNQIAFYYTKRMDLAYTLRCINKDTGAQISSETKQDQKFADEVELTAPDIRGYTFAGEEEVVTLTIGADSDENVVEFAYEPLKDRQYKIQYRDLETREEIAPEEVFENQTFDSVHTIHSIQIEGYYSGEASIDFTVGLTDEENLIIFYYTKRADLGYTVHYTALGADGEANESLRWSENGYNRTYKERISLKADSFEGYELVGAAICGQEVPLENIDGGRGITLEIGVSANEVSFYYAKRTDLSYTVNYYERTSTGDVLIESETQGDQTYGTSIPVKAKAIEGFSCTNPDQVAYIGANSDQNVVNFYYERRTDIPYKVRFLEKGTETSVSPEMSFEGAFEEVIAADDKKINIDGFTYDSAERDEIALGMDADANVLTLYYERRSDLSYTVSYVARNADGTSTQIHDPLVVENKAYEEAIEVEAPEVEGHVVDSYTFNGAPFDPETDAITVGAYQNEVTITYVKRADLSYTVNCVEMVSGQPVAIEGQEPVIVSNQTFGADVWVYAPTIEGYAVLGDASQQLTIKADESENQVTFTYVKRSDLSYTVHYVERETGDVLLSPTTGPNFAYGEEVTVEAVEIEGYGLDSDSRVTITIGTTTNDVYFYYVKRSDLSYEVRYINQTTYLPLAPAKTVEGQVFKSTVRETAIGIEGYNVVGDAERTIEIAARNNVLVFYYAPRTDLSYTVKYLEEGTDREVADPIVVSGQRFGDVVDVDAVSVDGYNVVGMGKDSIEISLDSNELVFYYAPRTDLSYSMRFLVQGTGEWLGASTVGDQTFDTEVEVTAPDFDGYVPVEATQVVTITTGTNNVTFYYTPRTDLSYDVFYFEQGTEDSVADPKTVTGQTYRSRVVENAIEIGGYTLVSGYSQAITIGLQNEPIVFYYAPIPATNPVDDEDQSPIVVVGPFSDDPIGPSAIGSDAPLDDAGLTGDAGDAVGAGDAADADAAGATIEDDANPLAGPNESTINDDATPMGAFDSPTCWAHNLMILGILLTLIYGIGVIARRLGYAKRINSFGILK